MRIAAVEAGGTKFNIGIVETDDRGSACPTILTQTKIATTTPDETLSGVVEFFKGAQKKFGHFDALGIGSFGPIVLDKSDPQWGHVSVTPKPHWQGANIAPFLGQCFGLAPFFDTDVNAAAAGEGRWGRAQGLTDFIYLTVGTGIGGGAFSGGRLVHGWSHPEFGHIKIAKEVGDSYAGSCPYHGDCLEGLVAGPAIGGRYGTKAENLPAEHPAWQLAAKYLARACASFVYLYSPKLILIGGGVGMRPGLTKAVAVELKAELAGYFPHLDSVAVLSQFVCNPGLGDQAGFLGSAALVWTH